MTAGSPAAISLSGGGDVWGVDGAPSCFGSGSVLPGVRPDAFSSATALSGEATVGLSSDRVDSAAPLGGLTGPLEEEGPTDEGALVSPPTPSNMRLKQKALTAVVPYESSELACASSSSSSADSSS